MTAISKADLMILTVVVALVIVCIRNLIVGKIKGTLACSCGAKSCAGCAGCKAMIQKRT